MIPYARQDIQQADIDAVIEVLNSDFLTQGEVVPNFEQAVAKRINASHAVSCNSGTSALHLACLALGLGDGDELWTSPNSFVASANCALYCGASVDFVDIDPQSYLMCPNKLEEKLKTSKRLPKIVVPVHFAGQSCDMQAIARLAKEYGFSIIEDASHAIGGSYQGKSIGDCRHSDITVFSFHPVKIITTGEGGMATTNKTDLAEHMSQLRSHGITRDDIKMTQPSHGAWYYEQLELGYNYRMTDIHAALGLSQLQRLDEYIKRRHEIANLYNKELAGLPLTLPYQIASNHSAYHLYVIRLNDTSVHSRVFNGMREAGINVNLHYIPIHLQPYYKSLGFCDGDFPEAEEYYKSAISLPMFTNLTQEQQSQVVATLSEILS